MNRHSITDIPASVRARLLNKSREAKRPFIEMLQYYAMERFLYRLSVSPHAHKFFLKGALMFNVWNLSNHRSTMDIDLLGTTKNSVKNLESICCDICTQVLSFEDGILFDPNTIKGTEIQTEAEYRGIRIEFKGNLNKANINMQIDIGFGDVILPQPQTLAYPTILDFPAPQLQAYTRESVIAEKLEAMIKKGMNNSRMKDFFDIWTLSRQFAFQSKALVSSVKATFQQRGTDFNLFPECFSEAFIDNPVKNAQWNAFILKNHLQSNFLSLKTVILDITAFLQPILNQVQQEDMTKNHTWLPANKWIEDPINLM
jgi:predicted nucleotidyltransferase component of viral defense system